MRVQSIVFIVSALSQTAFSIDWQFRSAAMLAAEGGILTGYKVPLNSTTQREYDDESAKSGASLAAINKIQTLKLQGLEGFATGMMVMGYEGFSNDLRWQSSIDLKGSAGVGNSSGRFYSPPFDPIFPTQGRGGRNSGWLAGAEGNLYWVPFNSFSARLKTAFLSGTDRFKTTFSRLQLDSEIELKAGRFAINPGFGFQRLLAGDALPAADISQWSLDLEWLGHKTIRFQNPRGYPLIKLSRAQALGSALLVTAMENEGRFFEINLTPKISLTDQTSFSSHFRSVSSSERSYLAPSLADELNRRGREQNDWRPPAASADFSSHTIEWRNSLNQRMGGGWNLYATVMYTSQANTFAQTVNSNLRYSDLTDSAGESSLRYFLGSEFLL